ncbi:MAG: universal stress protein [Chloroflexota bacterium]|nr:universal stress protein [Chloroflexota bacterium]
MYSSVLVPLDGSPLSERALDYAKPIVRGSGGRLTLVQAVHPGPSAGMDPAQAQINSIRAAELAMTKHVAALRAEGFRAERHIECGQPWDVILRSIHKLKADLVVMSTHGHSGLARVIYGAVADHVLRHSEAPVLLIPLNCERVWTGEAPRGVLLPLDGSALAEEALPPAVGLAGSLNATITLLQVVQPFPPPSPYEGVSAAFDAQAALTEARDYLSTIQASPAVSDLVVDKVALVGHPAAMICSEAEKEQAAAIVMATHGRGGLARLVLGSVATSVLQACRRPMLLVCPKAISGHLSHVHVLQASRI